MTHIFIDLEMQPIPHHMKEVRAVCQREIIEIGAVALGDDLSEIASYKEYVKPEYAPRITAKIHDLTGISEKDLVCARSFAAALNAFAGWCHSFDGMITVYAWSESDYQQITKEAALKGVEWNEDVRVMFSNWIDFQKLFAALIGEENPIALEKALSLIGIRFDGAKHDALCDARNTAILYRAARTEEDLKGIVEGIRIWKGIPSEPANTLGDMLDFTEILSSVAS